MTTITDGHGGHKRTDWFTDSRFGLFVHYGLYSLAARHEWVRHNEKLSDQHYQRYFEHFRADRFDPYVWARQAREAGMRYAVLTSKHHEGFCLWDSDLTDFKSTNTPAKRDLVAEFVKAFRAEGLAVGLYHSLIDWHHPDFPLDGLHPSWNESTAEHDNAVRDGTRYTDYLHGQVRELIERFSPDVLWFDFSYPGNALVPGGKGADFWRSAELVDLIRSLDPAVLLNDRLDLPAAADFVTPEEVQPLTGPTGQLWEACRTLNGSWGYAPGYQQWLDASQIIGLLIDSVSKGGNLLLNVGPTARGNFERRASMLLAEVGRWVELHGDAIYGAGPSQVPSPAGCTVTQNGARVFIHLTGGWPTGHLVLPGLPIALRYASFLHDGAEVQHSVIGEKPPPAPHVIPAGPDGATLLTLALTRPDVAVPVIELDLDW
jgi:Alpha-L-fucosidase